MDGNYRTQYGLLRASLSESKTLGVEKLDHLLEECKQLWFGCFTTYDIMAFELPLLCQAWFSSGAQPCRIA